jgi:ER lumen protein retaining receptor
VQVYNTVMKVVFLVTSYSIVYLIKVQMHDTYDKQNDTFKMIVCVVPAAILACFVNYYPNPQEVSVWKAEPCVLESPTHSP